MCGHKPGAAGSCRRQEGPPPPAQPQRLQGAGPTGTWISDLGLGTGREYASTVLILPSLGAQDMKTVLHRQPTGNVSQLGCTWGDSPRRPC